MPLKSRQASQKHNPTSDAPGANSRITAKSKAGGPQPVAEHPPTQYPDPNVFLPPSLASLRRDWRWAAVSQFLYTFQGPLRIDPYIEIELEEDLAYGSDIALSKIVHRLLFTLAGDRKITPQNWMGYLQGQYTRRYSPRPNPFYQDMFPLTHPSDDTHSEHKNTESAGDEPREVTPISEPDLSAERKPNGDHLPTDPTDPTDNLAEDASPKEEPGPLVEPVKLLPMRQWSDLSQSEQLDVLWTLCEWQFTGVMRLRNVMGEEDSGVGWRMEPVGWDSKKNTYWLVGETRLWVQHPLPQPPKPSGKKRSRAAQTLVVPLEPTISSRARPSFDSDDDENYGAQERLPSLDKEQSSSRESSESLSPPPMPTQSKKRTTNSEKRQSDDSASGSRKRPKVAPTRVSLRLRGSEKKEQEESHEEKSAKPVDDPFGSDSDLTEVEELEREIEERKKRERGRRSGRRTKRMATQPEESEQDDQVEEDPGAKSTQLPLRLKVAPPVDPMLPPPLPPGFVEWETVCASVQDWEAFPARFEKSTNPSEKSFRSYLNKILVPAVVTALKSQLKVKKLETAVQNRKRSSRLAIKESIIEAQRQDEERRAAELELHARSRRLEERERRQQEDLLKREREREAREARAGRRTGRDGSESGSASPAPAPEMPMDPPVKIRLRTGRIQSATPIASPVESSPVSGSTSGTTSRTDDSWELLCEGCGKQGWNTEDWSQLVKCESCNRWSHVACHDRADELAGIPKRNWSTVEFICRACSNTARRPGLNGIAKLNGPGVDSGPVLGHRDSLIPHPQPLQPVSYTYAAPNGYLAPQLAYPAAQAVHSSQVTQPIHSHHLHPVPFAHPPQQPSPVPIPQFQTPVPPLSQPAYMNGQ